MALPWVISPLVDALIERGEVEEAAALGDADRPRERLARGLRLHVPARQPRAAAAGAGPRDRGAAPRARVRRAASARGASATPASSPGARRSPPRSHATGRTEEALDACDEQADLARAVRRRARARAWRCSRSAGSPATPTTLRAAVDVLARLAGAARVRPRAGRARRPRFAARRRSSSPSAAARPRSPRTPATARRRRRAAPPRRAHRRRGADRRPGARRPARRGRARQPRDRRAAVRDREDRRGPPRRGLPQARDRLAQPARARARRSRGE